MNTRCRIILERWSAFNTWGVPKTDEIISFKTSTKYCVLSFDEEANFEGTAVGSNLLRRTEVEKSVSLKWRQIKWRQWDPVSMAYLSRRISNVYTRQSTVLLKDYLGICNRQVDRFRKTCLSRTSEQHLHVKNHVFNLRQKSFIWNKS